MIELTRRWHGKPVMPNPATQHGFVFGYGIPRQGLYWQYPLIDLLTKYAVGKNSINGHRVSAMRRTARDTRRN